MRYTFHSYERLKRKQDIDTLFQSGKAFSVFPLRLLYAFGPAAGDPARVKIGFSVPKRKFRKAVHRNRIKRLLREAWRLQKAEVCQAMDGLPDRRLHVFVIFTQAVMPSYEEVTAAVQKVLPQLHKLIAREHA